MNKFEYVKNIKNEGWNKNLDFEKEVALAMLTNSPIQNLTKENVINWLEGTDNKAEDYHYDYLALYQLKSRVVFDKKQSINLIENLNQRILDLEKIVLI